MMTLVSQIYNTLPNLGDADAAFTDREAKFAAVAQLLARHGCAGQFHLCLVHAHCTLADDEIMLARGNISEPTKPAELTEGAAAAVYPERWMLPSGAPYEFTTTRTEAPPAALLAELAELMRDDKAPVLGLCYAGGGCWWWG